MASTLPIYVTNTLGHKLERFEPLNEGEVRLYSCGPTVYSYVHTGNFRAYIFADTLRRMLEYNGYNVRHVRNITDVGHLTDETVNSGADKIEAAARRQNMTPWDIAAHYTDLFFRDAERLNLLPAHENPRATEYIDQMIALVQRLVESDHAYAAEGNVYFAVSTFPSYGRLSGNTVDALIAGARVEVGDEKRFPADFALWKAAAADKIMRWDSPWGTGVPGWHIECSAMAMDLLGEQIDIHTGGQDNVFPHHEDERAQSESATGKAFARYWMHNAFLDAAGGEKMSKSLGNIYTVQDLVDRGFHPLSYRYFTFNAHYRTPLNFSWEALDAAQTTLLRIWESVAEWHQSGGTEEPGKVAETYRMRFHEAINRDLDMSGAVAVLHEVSGSKLPSGQKLALLYDFDRVLGLDLGAWAERLSQVTEEQQRLLDERGKARLTKDWGRSDALRAELNATGLEVRDSAQGQRWVRRDLLPHSQPQDSAE